ncbi:precorrin-3B synthase [Thiohalorhabdus sp.]|uniref:precorrin-3B synthase n=1 Tax=Thiohalorhabdus sp. TaxID=3094134 RepID=UPI002FC38860
MGDRGEANPWVRQACPGVAAPMATGDGLLLRLRHPVGGLTPEQARTVADVARRFGSGELEITSRANLQLRGFSGASLPRAREELAVTGLVDADPQTEAVRNVVASPAADRDPQAVADVRGLARELAAAVTQRPALLELPPKVGLLVDGGGRARLDRLAADLRLEAMATAAGVCYRVAAGGTAQTAAVLGWVAPERAVAVAAAVLERFQALRRTVEDPPRRLSGAVARFGTEPLVGVEGLEPAAGMEPVARQPVSDPGATLGTDPEGVWVGAAFPFGALTADQLAGLAQLIDGDRGGALRLTPWRAVLLTGAREGALSGLDALGAVTEGTDRRLALGACVGAPRCEAGAVEARAEVRDLAEAAGDLPARGGRLHVSGCDKHCGDPAAATAVLTATGEGYNLALGDGTHLHPLATGLDRDAAQRWLAALERLVAAEQREAEAVDATIERLDRTDLADRLQREAEDDG